MTGLKGLGGRPIEDHELIKEKHELYTKEHAEELELENALGKLVLPIPTHVRATLQANEKPSQQ